jgi:predicted protein tyrosine phosphatase
MAMVNLRNQYVRAAVRNGLSSSASPATKRLVAALGCMVERWGTPSLKLAAWPHEAVANFTLGMKSNHASDCDVDSVAAFNVAVASCFNDYSIPQHELVELVGDGRTPLNRLGDAISKYTQGKALAAFNSWRRTVASKEGKDLVLDSNLTTLDTSMKGWRRIDHIPTEEGLLYVSNRDVLDGDLRLWAGAHRHRVLSVIDSKLVPAMKYQEWQLPGAGQSLRIDVHDKPSQIDVETLLQALPRALDFISKATQEKHVVVVHCAAGQSRSVAVVLAHKMIAEGLPLAEAFAHVVAQRPQAMPNAHFMKALAALDDKFSGLPKGMPRYSVLTQFVKAIPRNIGDIITPAELEYRVPGYSTKQAEKYYNQKLYSGGSTV